MDYFSWVTNGLSGLDPKVGSVKGEYVGTGRTEGVVKSGFLRGRNYIQAVSRGHDIKSGGRGKRT